MYLLKLLRAPSLLEKFEIPKMYSLQTNPKPQDINSYHHTGHYHCYICRRLAVVKWVPIGFEKREEGGAILGSSRCFLFIFSKKGGADPYCIHENNKSTQMSYDK